MNAANPISRIKAKGDSFSLGFAPDQAAKEDIREYVFLTEEFWMLESRWNGADYLRKFENVARANYPTFVRKIGGIASMTHPLTRCS